MYHRTQYTFNDYLKDVSLHIARYPELRAGQAYFNILSIKRSNLAEQIRGSDTDPFYDNNLIPQFLARVLARWD